MKLTFGKCEHCYHRAHFTKPALDPVCPVCKAPLERTSRLSIGLWYVDGKRIGITGWADRCMDYDHALRA